MFESNNKLEQINLIFINNTMLMNTAFLSILHIYNPKYLFDAKAIRNI